MYNYWLGQTIHNTFKFQFGTASQGLGDKARDNMRTVLKNLRFGEKQEIAGPNYFTFLSVVIDEYSMIPSDMIYKISKRLR